MRELTDFSLGRWQRRLRCAAVVPQLLCGVALRGSLGTPRMSVHVGGGGWMRVHRVLALGVTLVVSMPAGQALAEGHDSDLPNGGFEARTLTPWQTSTLGEGDSGWGRYSGTHAPISGLPIISPPFGRHAAVADQNGPGSNVLFRTFRVDGDDGQLRIWVWYHNYADDFFTPPSLFDTGAHNQQLRIDLVRPSASLRSLKPTAVLATPFRTVSGDALERGPFLVRVHLRRWEGRRVRLRITEVDNQSNFDVVVDGVRMLDRSGQPD
jgi:hypothetical protein